MSQSFPEPTDLLPEHIDYIERILQTISDRHPDSQLIQQGKVIVEAYLDQLKVVKPREPSPPPPPPAAVAPAPAPRSPAMDLIQQHMEILERRDEEPREDGNNNGTMPGLMADSPRTPESPGSVESLEEILHQVQNHALRLG